MLHPVKSLGAKPLYARSLPIDRTDKSLAPSLGITHGRKPREEGSLLLSSRRSRRSDITNRETRSGPIIAHTYKMRPGEGRSSEKRTNKQTDVYRNAYPVIGNTRTVTSAYADMFP